MKLKTWTFLRALAVAVAAGGVGAAANGAPDDDMLTLGPVSHPVLRAGGAMPSAPTNTYPLAAAGTRAAGALAAFNPSGSRDYELVGYQIGMPVSQQPKDFYIGQYCDRFPDDDPSRVDWNKTYQNLAGEIASGAVFVNRNASDPAKRILFTLGGRATTVTWVYYDVAGNEKTQTDVYQICEVSATRPHRLYWTEAPFNAPAVNLQGKFVKPFGSPEIVNPLMETNEVSKTTSVRRGIWFDESSKTLRAKAELTGSGYIGPKGQFVLCYYKSGDCRDADFICSIVVEVGEPRQTEIAAEVGDELFPSGDGWSIEGLNPKVSKGAERSDDDPMSPYAEIFEHVDGTTGKKVQSVYAVTPTDAASMAAGLDSPWKIDIYWQSPDPMDTLWPFERAWYRVTWPEACDRVIYAADAPLGAGVLVPTNYTASLCDYQLPSGTAALNGQAVRVMRDGHFTVKLLQGTERVFYVPFVSCASTSNSVVNRAESAVRRVTVGTELTPNFNERAGGTAGESYLSVDDTLPGYIHRPNSKGLNWNARLYHDPLVPQLVDTSAATEIGQESVDPFAKAVSAIYPVSASAEPIEVWWRSSAYPFSLRYEAPAALEYPSSVQLYRAEWPEPYQIPEIALASELGSEGLSLQEGGTAVFWLDGQDSIRLEDYEGGPTFDLAEGQDWGFGLWLNRGSRNALLPEEQAGRIFTLEMEDCGGLAFAVDYDGNGQLKLCSATTAVTNTANVSIGSNEWTYVWGSVYRGAAVDAQGRTNDTYQLEMGASSVRQPDATLPAAVRVELTAEQYALLTVGGVDNLVLGAEGKASAALGVAVDDVFLMRQKTNAERTLADEDDAVWFGFVFDDVELWPEWDDEDLAWLDNPWQNVTLCFFDNESFTYLRGTSGVRTMAPGAPRVTDGRVPADEATPEVYRQIEKNGVGYHPNFAHAFTAQAEDGAHVTWAVRSDLAAKPYEEGLVFTMYVEGGRNRMRTYAVVLTNEYYSDFSSSVTVGKQMLPPKPLRLLDGYWNASNSWTAVEANNGEDKTIVYRDRKLNDWAKRDGGGYAFYHYKVREDFDWPDGSRGAKAGELTPWVPGLGWYWSAEWPTPDTVPTMRVAETLTKAKNMLPEVWNMASCAVIYPDPTIAWNIVDLIDPVTKQGVDLPVKNDFVGEYGFTLGNSGTVQMRDGKYYFVGAPASVSDRFFYDPNAAANRLFLIGQLVEPATGDPYLQVNTLTAQEARELKDLCKLAATEANKKLWDKAIDELAAKRPILPSKPDPKSVQTWSQQTPAYVQERFVTNVLTRLQMKAKYGDAVKVTDMSNVVTKVEGLVQAKNVKPKYDRVSNYALMANGNDAGYVTIIENDNPDTQVVEEGLPVNVKVIRVVPELYAGTIRPLVDPLNKLSEKLVIQYNEPFGSSSTNFVFEWRRRAPAADGTIDRDYDHWTPYARGEGLTSFVLGTNGTSLAELANMYYVMRYWPNEGTMAHLTVNGAKSNHIGPTLAEGWVQRVLNALTPFTQRVEDFYSNPSDIWYTMFEQIGKPFRGDVALNNANLTEVGLLELYQTIFNKAEKMSVANGVSDLGVNKQLLLAASRIADFYMLLGAEAYADAKNPLVEQRSIDGMEDSSMALPSSTFCFQNQVRTLLDEELALLRGRTCANQPDMKTQPIYNRLIWNFTKGITEGEVAYVNNYGIRATDGVLTVDQAAKQYPQGHGDAWGHYLSAITGYYRLLRNPNFAWTASMMEMMISQSVVNNDDADEQKFADAALKLAQTGLDTVDLTARKAWRDNAGDPMAAYFDSADAKVEYEGSEGKTITVREGFGYGQWATRAGLGGIYNWAVVNSLLPTNGEPAAVYADKGLRQITRATATQLASLCDTVNAIQQKVNTLDAGLNPLGLDPNAIPMDIDPSELESKNSHFDQLLARTERALENAGTVLDYANRYGARLKQIQNEETDAIAANAAQEREYTKQLIELYGKPFAGDIGPGGLYVQGYDGPDLYHYMWMDTSTYVVGNVKLSEFADYTNVAYKVATNRANLAVLNVNVPIHFEFDKSGIIKMPSGMGSRAYEGRLQAANRKFLSALNDYNTKKGYFTFAINNYTEERARLMGLYGSKLTLSALEKIYATFKISYQQHKADTGTVKDIKTALAEFADEKNLVLRDAIPEVQVAGLSMSVSPNSLFSAAVGPILTAEIVKKMGAKITFSSALNQIEEALAWIDWADSMANYAIKLTEDQFNMWKDLKSICVDTLTKAYDVRAAAIVLNEAYGDIANLIDEGQRLQREREAVRQKISNAATQFRYMDMYNRVQRNNALTKYSASYDIAQRYVWELAKVYDYETGALSADGESGAAFLAEAIAARQLGEKGVVTGQATDKGLWDIVTRMKENWAVEKGRLGVNNPDTATKTFSLRYELFRIRPDVSGDAAWRKELAKYWVDDLKSNADYARYCQPLVSQTATVVKEPGLVIPFSTSINNAENFFGRTLQGGETQFSSADYVTKIHAVGVDFAGYDALTTQTAGGLATEPNVYLVPAGTDYMRSPAGDREVLGWSVVDQVMPLPYKVGSTQLDDESWIAGLDGTDGGSASGAVIRRHSTLRANGGTTSTRLVGRSVWNDRWILVIPASSLNANRVQGLETFIKGVSDIKLAIKAYSRQGN